MGALILAEPGRPDAGRRPAAPSARYTTLNGMVNPTERSQLSSSRHAVGASRARSSPVGSPRSMSRALHGGGFVMTYNGYSLARLQGRQR
jgi:hypothetical protein